ncbi:hypothetical protein GALL_220360 [mine drainage metagenome]|uniref:Uncharacterized protein n=1 Tax=mine drainage metagenome TaxID=410659 RepID=A0A1J5RVA9_9ZZZZ
MHQHQRQGPLPGQALRQRDVGVEVGLRGAANVLAGARLAGADGGDLGPHHGAIDQVSVEHSEAGIVAGRLQVGVQEAVGEFVAAAQLQIHDQEGDLAHHVHPAQPGIELDAVEGHRRLVYPGDVAQVQVAVALAHEAAGAARLVSRDQRRVPAPAPGLDRVQRG